MTTKIKTKKQHYIPRFLLSKFSDENGLIHTFHKSTGTMFRTNVFNVGHENYFYSKTNSDGNTIEAEGFTEIFDNIGSNCVNKLLNSSHYILDKTTICELSQFISVMMLRTPHNRNSFEYFRKHMLNWLDSDIAINNDPKKLGEYTLDDSAHSSIEMMMRDFHKYAEILYNKSWFLLEDPNESLTISDNAVVKHNNLDYGPRGNLGILQKGIEVYLPISPRFCIYIMCPLIFNEIASSRVEYGLHDEQQEELVSAMQNGHTIELKLDNTIFINSLQISQSEKYVYGKEKRSFDLGIDMTGTHPINKLPASESLCHGLND